MDTILQAVRDRMTSEGLDTRTVARLIGVTESALKRHLAGGYVRSDSLAKYRRWLSGELDVPQPELFEPEAPSSIEQLPTDTRVHEPFQPFRGHRPSRRHRVVDLFCGGGGLSLGFELAAGGDTFQTVLALDVENAMVAVYNDNQQQRTAAAIARRVDISDFINEAEVLAFYLDHLAAVEADSDLAVELDSLPFAGITAFKAAVQQLDQLFLERLEELRESQAFREAYRAVGPNPFGQTSVIGFYDSLHLPMPSRKDQTVLPMLWARSRGDQTECTDVGRPITIPQELVSKIQAELRLRWDRAVAELNRRTAGGGRGQLASSAERISRFVEFASSASMLQVRDLWLQWRSHRDALRFTFFDNAEVLAVLERAYSAGREVSVILGGPPCQGFSRIGRGKIRSLREDNVHVHYDSAAGDTRNLLLHKYVLYVSALSPLVFLFENVRHFKAKLNTPEGTFLATDVLAEAISAVGRGQTKYEVASRTIMASHHLVPQTRDRFFMVGVRSGVAAAIPESQAAASCLSLQRAPALPLELALEGLPGPYLIADSGGAAQLRRTVPVDLGGGGASTPAGIYVDWVTQPSPEEKSRPEVRLVDAHHARDTRADDREFFRLMGPGLRWMDYRCDESPTLKDLREAVSTLVDLLESSEDSPSTLEPPLGSPRGRTSKQSLSDLLERLDGSLTLRLLLEGIAPLPGEPSHHLLTPNYLGKRDGNHGDWLARLDAKRPCKTIVQHMGKDTYAYVHPAEPRTLSVREAARVQTFPDWFRLGSVGLVDAFRVIGNAVPPLLSAQLGERVAHLLAQHEAAQLGSAARTSLAGTGASN